MCTGFSRGKNGLEVKKICERDASDRKIARVVENSKYRKRKKKKKREASVFKVASQLESLALHRHNTSRAVGGCSGLPLTPYHARHRPIKRSYIRSGDCLKLSTLRLVGLLLLLPPSSYITYPELCGY